MRREKDNGPVFADGTGKRHEDVTEQRTGADARRTGQNCTECPDLVIKEQEE